jgi:DNA-directed RNA polymerase specialized sigma24 family protein
MEPGVLRPMRPGCDPQSAAPRAGCVPGSSGHLVFVDPQHPDRVGAFEVLFGATYSRVLSYARAMADPDEVDDAVAETYTVAWRRLEDIPEGAELGWLIGVTRRVLANTRRGTRRLNTLRSALGMEQRIVGPDPADRVLDDGIRKALHSLRPLDREALVLVAWFELDPIEAATALGIGAPAFRMRLARARRRMRTALDTVDACAPNLPLTTTEAPQWHQS